MGRQLGQEARVVAVGEHEDVALDLVVLPAQELVLPPRLLDLAASSRLVGLQLEVLRQQVVHGVADLALLRDDLLVLRLGPLELLLEVAELALELAALLVEVLGDGLEHEVPVPVVLLQDLGGRQDLAVLLGQGRELLLQAPALLPLLGQRGLGALALLREAAAVLLQRAELLARGGPGPARAVPLGLGLLALPGAALHLPPQLLVRVAHALPPPALLLLLRPQVLRLPPRGRGRGLRRRVLPPHELLVLRQPGHEALLLPPRLLGGGPRGRDALPGLPDLPAGPLDLPLEAAVLRA
mmetsp:Transcript_12776/g.36275  ORF Transcript_12776/g.36275 Transcript_12776/m.36275 type:complete len:297 (-) Transcript_12776:245-1135(-)